jgi:CHAT domain-containing protein
LQRFDQLVNRLPETSSPERARQLDDLARRRGAAQVAVSEFEAELARKYGPAAGEVYDLAAVQARLPADAALLAWVDLPARAAADPAGDHWACVVRHQGEPTWIKLSGTGPEGAWTTNDTRLARRLAQVLAQPPQGAAAWPDLAEQFARQRLAPVIQALAGRGGPPLRRLIVLPSPALEGLPVEALLRETEPWTVTYSPSGTLLSWLCRPPAGDPPSSHRLLALADPALPRGARGEATPGVVPLPGTRHEVEAIRTTFRAVDPNAECLLLLGPDASEQRLADLATRGELAHFRYLHLATHGVPDQRRALQSALVLARDALPDPVSQALAGRPILEGRLTAEQVLRTWRLEADLVVLSACESAVGKPGGGEGPLGFAQALFLAGARSVVLSLWKVDDVATALLMQRFYENLLGRRGPPLAKAEALRQAKHWLRDLTAAEVETLTANLPAAERGAVRERAGAKRSPSVRPYAHPYYWSAFILLGDPG